MHYCSMCKVEKDKSEFHYKDRAKTKLKNLCKECTRQCSRNYYNRNKQEHIERSVRNSKTKRDEFQAFKSTLKCAICPEDDSSCLDFHHLDPDEKDMEVNKLVTYSAERLKEELAKCIILCSNCHRKFHAGIFCLI